MLLSLHKLNIDNISDFSRSYDNETGYNEIMEDMLHEKYIHYAEISCGDYKK